MVEFVLYWYFGDFFWVFVWYVNVVLDVCVVFVSGSEIIYGDGVWWYLWCVDVDWWCRIVVVQVDKLVCVCYFYYVGYYYYEYFVDLVFVGVKYYIVFSIVF